MSSEEGGLGLKLAERFFGFILIIMGVLDMYYTFTSLDTLGLFTGFFGFLGLILLVIGWILITAKTE
jgi:hypothetical protein